MKKSIIGLSVVGILVLGLTLPAIASAGWFNWGCRYQGTWFGVAAEDDQALAGWMVTVEGKSHFHGTNNLEGTADAFDPRVPIFDPDTGAFVEYLFQDAVPGTTFRGNWMRTGYNTFVYTTTGFGVDAAGNTLYVAKLSGHITLTESCNALELTATVQVYPVFLFGKIVNPFGLDTPFTQVLPNERAFRAFIDLP